MSKVKLIVIPIVVFVVAAVALYLYLSLKRSPVIPAPTSPQPAASQPAAGSQALGAKIYDQAANPLKDKVPTVSPVVNPVQGLYKNPFE